MISSVESTSTENTIKTITHLQPSLQPFLGQEEDPRGSGHGRSLHVSDTQVRIRVCLRKDSDSEILHPSETLPCLAALGFKGNTGRNVELQTGLGSSFTQGELSPKMPQNPQTSSCHPKGRI